MEREEATVLSVVVNSFVDSQKKVVEINVDIVTSEKFVTINSNSSEEVVDVWLRLQMAHTSIDAS